MRVVRTVVVQEIRLLVSLVLWVARRLHGVGDGRAFGYARGQGAVMAGFGFVCVVETFTMSVLLREWPTAHRVVLVLDVYTLLFVVGLYAATAVRPHVLYGDELRVRYAGHVDLRIPLERIAAVRRERAHPHERADGELNLAVGSQTSLTLELTEPVAHFTLLGRRRDITLVRLHADDADSLVQAVVQAVVHALTRERNAPSGVPDRPR
ncbi:hypothetical protein [Streptomyces sp. YKOK-I1]